MARRLRAGSRIEAVARDLDDEGLGVADGPGGRTLRIEDALPGEAGTVRVLHVGARIHGLIERRTGEASPSRRASLPCPRWTPASPCRVMHLSAQGQAAFKRERVARALAERGVVGVEVAPTLASPQTLGWRARATYVVAGRAGQLVLGAYRRGTHVVQPMLGCPLEMRPLSRAAEAIAAALDAVGIAPADPRLEVATDGGCGAPRDPKIRTTRTKKRARRPELDPDGLRYVAIRASTGGEVACALLTPSGRLPGADAVGRAAQAACPSLVGVHVGKSGAGDAIFGDGALKPVGAHRPLVETVAGLAIEISPRSFFQVNPGAADVLQALAAEAAGEGRVVDVYSGVGALALRIAQHASSVVGVESNEDAVADAERAAEAAGLAGRVRFVCDDAEDGLGDLARTGEGADAVVLNPPRKGCTPKVLEAAAALSPERIVYVSCNPRTLAADMAHLAARGYVADSVTPVDLFPHAEHVEVLAVLTRRGA